MCWGSSAGRRESRLDGGMPRPAAHIASDLTAAPPKSKQKDLDHMAKKTPTRLYLVSGPTGDRLVNASGHGQAIRHVSRGLFRSRIPTTIEVAELVAGGVSVEVAGADDQPELPIGQERA